MISRLAIDDIQDLEGLGIRLTPSEIVRLNELGLRVEHGQTAGDVIACPRIGWAGDIPIYQPTLQSEMWIDIYCNRWFEGDDSSLTACLLFACGHATVKGFFTTPQMLDRASVLQAVEAWHKGLNVTATQLRYALEYALYGCEVGSDIYPEPSDRKQGEENEKREVTEEDLRAYYIDEAIATQLGMSLEDIQTLTETRILHIIKTYNQNNGLCGKQSNVRAHAEYARTLAAIKKQHIEAKQNG